MEELFNQLKQTFSYLFGQKELSGIKVNSVETFEEEHQIELDEAVTSKRLNPAQKAKKIKEHAQGLLKKIDKLSNDVTSTIELINAQENESWHGYFWNMLGYRPESIQHLEKHLNAINQFTKNNKFSDIDNMQKLLESSFNARFMVAKLINVTKEDLNQVRKDLENKTTTASRPMSFAEARLAEQMNNSLGNVQR